MDSLITHDILARVILPYVGDYQFRIVGGVNRNFRNAYVDAFPSKQTMVCVDSVGHVKICLHEVPVNAGTAGGSVVVAPPLYNEIQTDYRLSQCLAMYAARDGNVPVLAWLHEQMSGGGGTSEDGLMISEIYDAAAANGHVHVLEWAHTHGCELLEETLEKAGEHGHVHVLQWANTNGCPWEKSACCRAAENGHLHVLQWAYAQNLPVFSKDDIICSLAAEFGQMEILQWAHAHGCPWNEDTCALAALCGNLDILKWARAHGCPWDEHTCTYARQEGHFHIVNWARSNGCLG